MTVKREYYQDNFLEQDIEKSDMKWVKESSGKERGSVRTDQDRNKK